MSAYPESMRYFLDEVNGFSTNTFKLFPQNQDSATANRILRFTLPSNSLLNLRSFSLFFNMTTEGNLAGGRLPLSRNSVMGWREDHLSNWAQKRNFSAQCIRLCLPETGVRKISGFDTRSVSLNGYYNMYNINAPRTVNLFCECTSVLRIGSARQLEVVQ